jgi:pimeloyl-ACP methyl ester carboxylesterase
MEMMTIHARDVTFSNGQELLSGRLFLPSKGPGPSPAAILVHGLGSDGRTMEAPARELALLGVAALTFDQRGHGRSAGVYTGDSSYDILAAASFLESLLEIIPGAVGVMGHSSGAREAIIACLRSPRLAVLVCTSTPPDSFGSDEGFYQRIGAIKPGMVTHYPEQGALPWLPGRLLPIASRLWSRIRGYRLRIDWVATLTEWSRLKPSLAMAEMAPRPTLFLHCQGDRTVPAMVSEVLYQKAAEPKRLVIVPKGWHAAPLASKRVRRVWTDWLAESLHAEAKRGVVAS